MGALTIAFDTTIVGALALPWVLLVIHLFFFEGEPRLGEVLDWIKELDQPAVVGVLLFAATYSLGSAVSRTAQDFFNDDDLFFSLYGHILRPGVTEDQILTSVYCDSDELLPSETGTPLAAKIHDFRTAPNQKEVCNFKMNWWVKPSFNWRENKLYDTAEELFYLQESGVLLRGDDYTTRLRQLHDQIMVLRGAAFNGLLAFALCLFGFGAKLRREKNLWAWALVPAPSVAAVVALVTTIHHFEVWPHKIGLPADPPYMEFTLWLVAFAGMWLVWRKPKALPPKPPENVLGVEASNGCWSIGHWGRLSFLAFILMMAAALAWWSTERTYCKLVISSYAELGVAAGGEGK